MKTAILTTALFAVAWLFVATAEPVEVSEEIPLSYVRAVTAYELLRSSSPELAAVVEVIQIAQNVIVLNPDHPRVAEVRAFLLSLDARPKQIKLQCSVSEIDAAGKEKIISRPTIYMVDGKDAEIWIGEQNGKKIKIEVTASNVPALAAE